MSEETTARQKIAAGWRILHSYGFAGDDWERKKEDKRK
jgi:hypothetical protein